MTTESCSYTVCLINDSSEDCQYVRGLVVAELDDVHGNEWAIYVSKGEKD
jgi:hypothetical protein